MQNVRGLLKDPGAKEHARLRVLRTVMARPGHQSELAKRAEVANATVSDAVRALERSGVVQVLRSGRESYVSLAPTEGLAVGVEVGFAKSVIVGRRFHLSHEQAASAVLPVGATDGLGVWVPRVVDRIMELVAETGDEPLDLGEIGHTVIDPAGAFCRCGGRGCLETVIGSAALLAQAEAVFSGEDPVRTLAGLVEAALAGDAVGRRVIKEAGLLLGRAVGNFCNLINPDVVVIGGTLAGAGELMLEPCRAGLRGAAMAAAYQEGFQLVSSGLEHGIAHGALLLGIAGTTYPTGSSR